MKSIVIYNSQTGFTEKYARWLAEDLGCEAVPFSDRHIVENETYDVVVFCSWFHAASLKGASWLKKRMTHHAEAPAPRHAETRVTHHAETGRASHVETHEAHHAKNHGMTLPQTHFVILAVGATPPPCEEWPEDEIEAAFRRTFPEEEYPTLPWFYCQGGFNFSKLSLPDKIAMRMFFSMLEKKAKDSPRDAEALESMRSGFDATNRASLTPLLEHLRNYERFVSDTVSSAANA